MSYCPTWLVAGSVSVYGRRVEEDPRQGAQLFLRDDDAHISRTVEIQVEGVAVIATHARNGRSWGGGA